MLQNLKFWHSALNGECIEWVDGYIVTTDSTGYMKPSNIIIVTGWNGKWLTISLVIIRKRIILVILHEKKEKVW